VDRIKQHVGDIVSSQLAVGRLLHRLHERGEKKPEMRIEGNRELPQKHKKPQSDGVGGESENNKGTTRVCWRKEEDEGQ
jgi:hypothetical protein